MGVRISKLLMAGALALSLPLTASAQTGGFSDEGFRAYVPQLRAQAVRDGGQPAHHRQRLCALAFSPRTIELDRGQPGGTTGYTPTPPFAPYKARHVSPELISRGRERYAANIGRLREIERRYGVSPSVLMAIWGHETSYGAVTGDFDLLNSLARPRL